jgi:hypothetical protein
MAEIIIATREECERLAAKVDLSLGYPKAGVRRGTGVHVPPEQAVTRTYSAPVQHPKDSRWAYPVDAATKPLLTTQEKSTLVVATADWKDTQVNPTPKDAQVDSGGKR